MASEEFDFKHNNFDIVRVRVVDLFGGYKTNTNTLAMIPTYSRVLSAIEKTLQELIEEY